MVADGGPAYPKAAVYRDDGQILDWPQDGMSLRDHFAGLAMQFIIEENWTVAFDGDQ